MRIGIAFDLKSEIERAHGALGPDDRLEEYDSTETVHAIAEALRAAGHEPFQLGGGRAFLERVLKDPPELVFNIAEGHGSRSREAHVPAVCELLGIACTHSDPLTLAVSLDKAMTKRLVSSQGVPTPKFAVIETEAQLAGMALRYPVISKPLGEGSSMGVRRHSRATNLQQLRTECARLLADYAQPVLVEEFCSGPEFTVGILGTGAAAGVIGVMEIVSRTARQEEFIYSLEVKRNWREEVEYHAPPKRSREQVAQIEAVALAAYRALGCRDLGRVDVRMTAALEPMFLEINPLPGLNPVTGDIVILATRVGLGFEGLIRAVVDSACRRRVA